MKLTVVEIGAITFDKQTIKMVHAIKTSTPLGDMSENVTYYARVHADSVKLEVNEELELDINLFDIELKAFTDKDGNLPVNKETGKKICNDDGTPIELKWLKFKEAA